MRKKKLEQYAEYFHSFIYTSKLPNTTCYETTSYRSTKPQNCFGSEQ